MKLFWLSRRAFNGIRPDWDYIFAQLSLDLIGWSPTHSVYIKFLGKNCRWYRRGKMPERRGVSIGGNNGMVIWRDEK